MINHHQTFSSYSDEQLLEVFQEQRSDGAMTELFRRYAHLVYYAGLKILKNEEDSKDLVSNVFLIFLKKRDFSTIKNFKSYLLICSRNEAILQIKKQKRRRDGYSEVLELENKLEVFMENEDFTNLIDKEASEEDLLLLSIEELAEKQKKCIKLFYLEEKTYKEIVQLTEFSLKEVKSYLQNGKRNLKNILSKKTRHT